MSPRFYQSNETAGDGDGLYEFRPKFMESMPYSQYKDIQMHQGKFSGQFLITYQQEPDDLASLTSDPRLTATIELSEISEFIKFQVDLNDIPI